MFESCSGQIPCEKMTGFPQQDHPTGASIFRSAPDNERPVAEIRSRGNTSVQQLGKVILVIVIIPDFTLQILVQISALTLIAVPFLACVSSRWHSWLPLRVAHFLCDNIRNPVSLSIAAYTSSSGLHAKSHKDNAAATLRTRAGVKNWKCAVLCCALPTQQQHVLARQIIMNEHRN